MSEIKMSTLSLLVDGKTIEVKKPSKLNFELNRALMTDKGFSEFTADPHGFAKKYDLTIDPELANQLKTKLVGIKNLTEMQAYMGGGHKPATAWAVAVGVYSIASSKLAVAF